MINISIAIFFGSSGGGFGDGFENVEKWRFIILDFFRQFGIKTEFVNVLYFWIL